MTTTPMTGPETGEALLLVAVTSALRSLLENGLFRYQIPAAIGTDVLFSALPPDRIQTGEEERAQINLFLFQAAPRGLLPRSRYAPAETDTESDRRAPGGSVEMTYLLTVFGVQDLHCDMLLGFILSMLRETPSLSGAVLKRTLANLASAQGGRFVLPALTAVQASPLMDRISEVRLTPQNLPMEQQSQIWALLQSRYRPTLFCKVTVMFHA